MDGIISVVTDMIDAAFLEAGADLKVVANVAAGYDNVDVPAATRRGVVVTNTPGVVTESTADLTWGLLFSIARRIPEADRYVRADKWKEWQLMALLGHDVHGRTLGIIGMGRIGQAVARRASGFGMTILYHNRHRLPESVESELGAVWVELETLLQSADFVSVHTPLSTETRHLIGERELRMMKPTAYLLNTSRGPVVDETAVIRALAGTVDRRRGTGRLRAGARGAAGAEGLGERRPAAAHRQRLGRQPHPHGGDGGAERGRRAARRAAAARGQPRGVRTENVGYFRIDEA